MPRFNPLTGISSILTQSSCSDAERRSPTFQSPDGDFVYSDLVTRYPVPTGDSVSFNPLTGISSILTNTLTPYRQGSTGRFNPLTGISSILTNCREAMEQSVDYQFQSPDGDFVYSDAGSRFGIGGGAAEFQSPDGDFVYSDLGRPGRTRRKKNEFQSPDGDFVYSDELLSFAFSVWQDAFQSPDGDFVYSDS